MFSCLLLKLSINIITSLIFLCRHQERRRSTCLHFFCLKIDKVENDIFFAITQSISQIVSVFTLLRIWNFESRNSSFDVRERIFILIIVITTTTTISFTFRLCFDQKYLKVIEFWFDFQYSDTHLYLFKYRIWIDINSKHKSIVIRRQRRNLLVVFHFDWSA